jgi:GntR family transcriptional regulator/MocR family aminotransferase
MTTLSSMKSPLRGISTLVAVDKESTTPLYRQIYDSYRARILTSELLGGQLVPSTRELARELGVSRLPVLNAYAQLLAEGYFEARVGTGTFVARSLPQTLSSDVRTAVGHIDRRERPISALALALPPYEEPYWANRLGPFHVGQPALDEFPVRLWSRVVSRCSRNLKVRALRYGSPMGLGELRQVIANYLRTSRGVRCEAAQIMIVNGSQQALDISTRVLLNAGARVWVEDPGYWLVHHVLKGAGCRAVPVPVDTDGLSVAEGIRLCRNGRAAFVAPSHQFPLGVTMSATRRLQLLDWAQRVGAWIIEDDYDSEYRYDSMPIASLQGLDDNARVIYIGTFSKVLFPALRLGYLVIPADLVERFAALRQSVDLCPPHENQVALAEFIRGGHFSRHVRQMRMIYAERRRILVREIERVFADDCTVVGANAGMHLTVLMRGTIKDHEVAARALRRKLLVSPLSIAYLGDTPQQGFVLGFGNTQAGQIREGVRLLKECLRKQ